MGLVRVDKGPVSLPFGPPGYTGGASVASLDVEGGRPATAVVVDRWPLVRLGLAAVLTAGGIPEVSQASKASEGLLLVRVRGIELVVFGSPLDGVSPATVRSAKHDVTPPKIVVLIPPADAAGAEVSALFAAGADALLVASIEPRELADALARVRRGERVVGPELGPSLTRRPVPEPPPPAPPDDENGSGSLTAKEREVLALLAQGHSNKQIARALYVSDATVKTHLQHIYGKLDAQNRFGALSRAKELGLLR
jgi:DNA-binding NarL/FixJ family response regulator